MKLMSPQRVTRYLRVADRKEYHIVRPLFSLFMGRTSRLEGSRYEPPRPIAARLLVLCGLRRSAPKYWVPFDERSETESNGSRDTFRGMTLGEWVKPSSIQNPPSGSHGFLRGAVVRFSSRRARSPQSHDGCPDSFTDSFTDKHSTKKAEVTSLNIIDRTTPDTASVPSDLPQTSNRKKYRSCLQFKCTDAFMIGIIPVFTNASSSTMLFHLRIQQVHGPVDRCRVVYAL